MKISHKLSTHNPFTGNNIIENHIWLIVNYWNVDLSCKISWSHWFSLHYFWNDNIVRCIDNVYKNN